MIFYSLVILAGIAAGIVIAKRWTAWRNAAEAKIKEKL